MNKNFESFKEFYWKINFKFTIVCFSETWVDDISFSKNSNFQLSSYQVLHQTRKNQKGGGVCAFVHENLSFKLKEDMSINCDAIQSLSIELSSTKSKNMILNTIYRSPNGDMKQFETYFKDVFSKNGKNLKNIVLAGDFNIDHIITNSVTGLNDFKSAMIKTDLSDHFPIVFAIKTNETT